MSHSTDEENDEFAVRANIYYPGEWKRLPRFARADILLRLPPGTYLIQHAGLIQTNIKLTEILYPPLLEQHRHFDYFRASDKPEETMRLAEISKIVGKINAKIDQLIGFPGGGNDPDLKELYLTLSSLFSSYYDSYIEVPRGTVWENSRECMGIVIEQPEPGLLYRNGVINRIGRKLVITPAQAAKLPSPTALNEMPECYVKLHRLESFMPKRHMDGHWNRWNVARKKKDKKEMPECFVVLKRLGTSVPKKRIRVYSNHYWDWDKTNKLQKGKEKMPCFIKLHRLETFVPKLFMDVYWKRYRDSVRQQKKQGGGNRKR